MKPMKHKARFKFIEAMILLNGSVQRAHLMRAFSLKDASASRILSDYKKVTNNAIAYRQGKRATVATEGFKPVFLDVDAETFFNAVQLVADEPIMTGDRVFCGCGEGCGWCGGDMYITPTVKEAKTRFEANDVNFTVADA